MTAQPWPELPRHDAASLDAANLDAASLEVTGLDPSSLEQQPAWMACGDYELNVAAVCGPPTLRPSPALEQRLQLPLPGLSAAAAAETHGRRLADGHPPLAGQVGVHVHAFHLPEFERILQALSRASRGGLPVFDLLVTTDTSQKRAAIEARLAETRLLSGQARRQVLVVPNRGRNLAPLLRQALPFLQSCELALHLHTKRSEHKPFGSDWLEDLLQALLPPEPRLRSLLQSFCAHPDLGLVMPRATDLIRPFLNWGADFDIAALICRAAFPERQLDPQAPLVFPPGMMFWFRPAALAPLAAALELLQPLPAEPLLHDGTPLHALERLTAHSCEVAGLRWALCGAEPAGDADPREPGPWSEAWFSVWQPRPARYLDGVAALAAGYRRQQQEQAALERQVTVLRAELEAHRRQLQERDAALARNEAVVRALEAELLALKQSLSWRLTGPLRRLRRALVARP